MQPISNRQHSSGFTIVELLVALPLVVMVLGVFVASLITAFRTTNVSKVQLDLNNAAVLALNTMERNVRYSNNYTTGITAPYTDPYGPSNTDGTWTGTWSYKGDSATNRVVILKSYATTENIFSPTRKTVYNDDLAYDCSATGTLYLNSQLPYYTIFFVNNQTLYRRIITDNNTTAVCNGPQYQKQTCPNGATRVARCKANDEVVATNVTSFSIDYFVQRDTPTPTFDQITDAYSSTDPTILDGADDAVINLTLSKQIAAEPVTATFSLRMSKVNGR